MSIKLYDLYLIHLPPAKLLDSDSRWFKSLQEKIRENARVEAAKFLATSIAYKWDDGKEYTYGDALMKLWDRQNEIEKTHHRDPEVDFNLSLLLYPVKRYKDRVFAYALVDNSTVRDVFEKHPKVQSYPYYDNTDPPDGMPWKLWKARGERVMKVIGKGALGARAFERKLMTLYDQPRPTMEDVVAHQPTIEHRARAHAKAKAINVLFPKYFKEGDSGQKGVRALFDCMDDEEYQPLFDKHFAECMERFKPFTKEDLEAAWEKKK